MAGGLRQTGQAVSYDEMSGEERCSVSLSNSNPWHKHASSLPNHARDDCIVWQAGQASWYSSVYLQYVQSSSR